MLPHQSFLLWIVVGLVAGWLASALLGGGYGLFGDLVVGLVGSFIGGLLFRAVGASMPASGGLFASLIVAFIGAVVLLFILRLVRRGTERKV